MAKDLINSLADLKEDDAPCINDFECKEGKCLEGLCSPGLKKEIVERKGLLEQILGALQGELPLGHKEITEDAPAIFTLDEIRRRRYLQNYQHKSKIIHHIKLSRKESIGILELLKHNWKEFKEFLIKQIKRK